MHGLYHNSHRNLPVKVTRLLKKVAQTFQDEYGLELP